MTGRSGAGWFHVPDWLYDVLYRRGAPWEMGPRSELVDLVESGVLTAEALPPGRAIDLGCGTGSNAVFLAQNGFDVTGVDFSKVALRKAQDRSVAADVAERTHWIRADLTKVPPERFHGSFDLLVDYGTLDDLNAGERVAMARTVRLLARPGARLVFWCFYGHPEELPLVRFDGTSRMAGTVRPGEEMDLFGDAFDIERLPEPAEDSGFACFLMTRRDGTPGTREA